MKPLTCIAIDDEPLFLRMISLYIKQITWLEMIDTYHEAAKGATAILTYQPDVVFLDIAMPHINGYSLIDWLLPQLNKLPELPSIVVISGKQEYVTPNQFVSLTLDKSQLADEQTFERLLLPHLRP